MMFLFLIIGGAVCTVVLLLLPVCAGRPRHAGGQRHDINIAAAAARLSELKQERAAGDIDDEQFRRYRFELEAMTLEELQDSATGKPNDHTGAETQMHRSDTVLAVIIALAVPVFSLLTYKQIGSESALLDSRALPADRFAQGGDGLKTMLAEVEARVQTDSNDLEGRIILGQVYMQEGRYGDAAVIYREAYQLRPYEPDILVQYADALARSHGNRLSGRPAELLDRALAIAPEHKRALWLAGFAEMQANKRPQALAHWRRLLAGLETGSESYRKIEGLIAEGAGAGTATTMPAGNRKHAIEVNVSLAPEFESRVGPNTTLFVFARASSGPPMPLAVYRGLAKELPLTITLDDSMAMVPQMSLARFPQVIVGARLSSNGQPQGQPGDLEGFSAVLETATTPTVEVLIDGIQP